MDAKYLVLAVIVGTAWAQSETDVLNSLPDEYKSKFNETQLEEIKNKSNALIKEKCDKNGGPDVFAKVQSQIELLPNCVKESLGISDPSVLQKEIDDAKPHGAVDEVFKKYCHKTPQVKACFLDTLEVAKPCFTAKEQESLDIIRNVTEQLAEFVCFKEGDRIALFIAEGGPECYQDKTEQVQDCMKTILGDQEFNPDNFTANSIPEFSFGDKECNQFLELQTCVVRALESCKTPTSANIVESLFKFARKGTPCVEPITEPEARSHTNGTNPGSASGVTVTSATIAIAAVTTLLL